MHPLLLAITQPFTSIGTLLEAASRRVEKPVTNTNKTIHFETSMIVRLLRMPEPVVFLPLHRSR
ncbi:hypothetical protein ABIF75_011675 [Bradyrhizobium japonicum]